MSVTPAPEVTVVIPTRDRRQLLSTRALPSALGQQEVSLEVVVVDDGSTDDTVEHVETLGDPRVSVIRQRRARGPSAARNAGIAAARTEWVAFLDDDDLWSPRKLRTQLQAASANGAGWAFARAVVVNEHGTIVASPALAEPEGLAATLLTGNRIWGGDSNVIAKTTLLHELGGFDERLQCFEDWDLWIRLAQSSPAAACPEVLVATLEHPDRMLFRFHPDVIDQLETMLVKHRAVTREDRLGVVEWLAGEHAQVGRRFAASRLYLRAALTYRSPGNLAPAVGVVFGDRGLRLAARLHLALRGRTHLRVSPAEGNDVTNVPWLAGGGAASA